MKGTYSVTIVEKKRNLKTVLFILCLFVSSVVIIVLVTRVNLKSASTQKPSEIKEQKVCNTTECIRSAMDILSAMNTSVQPCDDFYTFTCGRWKENANNNKFMENSDAVLKFLKSNGSLDDSAPLQKSKNMYRACMDEETRDKLKYTPVFKYLSLLGLPPVPSFIVNNATNDYKFDWMKTDIVMNTLLNEQLFVNCYVALNNFNISKRIIKCGIPKKHLFGLESVAISKKQTEKFKSVFMNNLTNKKIKTATYEFIKFCMSALIKEKYKMATTDDQLIKALNIIEEIENFLNTLKNMNSNHDHDMRIKIEDIQNYTTYHLIENKIKPKFVWKLYLEELFRYSNLSAAFENEDEIIISSENINYYGAIAGFVSDESDVKLELWAWWRAVSHLLMQTTSEIMQQRDKLMNILGLNIQTKESECANITNYYMNHAVTFALIDRSLLNRTKPKVQTMLQDLKEVFAIKVNSLKWMDSSIKNITLEKVKGLTDIGGIFDWSLNENNLESIYSNITINNETHLDNLVTHVKYRKKLNLQSLYSVNIKFWSDDPLMVNAYNNLTQNSSSIHKDILKYPIYDRGLEAFNYGSLGSMMGHELMNIIGKLENFNLYEWDNRTKFISAFKKCFKDQSNSSYVPEADELINTEKTLDENIADNGGLSLAYSGYENYKKRTGEQMKLPGLEEYTNDQLFFISYANIRCSKMKSGNSKYKHFALETIVNSEEFTEAFTCVQGSNINSIKQKCKLW